MLLSRATIVFSLFFPVLGSYLHRRSEHDRKGVIDYNPRPAYCPDIDSLEVPRNVSQLLVSAGDVRTDGDMLPFPDGIADHIETIGKGGSACVYGLVWDGKIAVAVKTAIYPGFPVDQKEISVLRRIEQYRGEARLRLPGPRENQERLFVFMKYVGGFELQKTKGYRRNIQALASTSLTRRTAKCHEVCKEFIAKTASKVTELYIHYLINHKVAHGDVGLHNILFSESWDIDGGDADMIDWGEVQLLDKDHNITSLIDNTFEKHMSHRDLNSWCG